MSFLLPMLEAAAPSIIGGLISGGANGILGGSNSALTGMLGENNVFQTGLMAQEMASQQQLDLQSTVFDEAMSQQSENLREVNTLRDVQMQQRKADDSIVKKFIESIGE